jgi:nucleotide-binding universal stress UspA family protein
MKLTEQLKKALSALAYAEMGEMLSAREKWQTVAPASSVRMPGAGLGQAVSPRKLVVLSLGSDPSHAAVQYAVNVCQRMSADLSVLCTSARVSELVLASHQAALSAANITFRTVAISGKPERAIKQYLQAHPQVMFIVAGSSDDPVQTLIGNGRWDRSVNAVSVPVVVAHDHRECCNEPQQPDQRQALASA